MKELGYASSRGELPAKRNVQAETPGTAGIKNQTAKGYIIQKRSVATFLTRKE
jgi:hypothetical protein